jgi:hypothetical protein
VVVELVWRQVLEDRADHAVAVGGREDEVSAPGVPHFGRTLHDLRFVRDYAHETRVVGALARVAARAHPGLKIRRDPKYVGPGSNPQALVALVVAEGEQQVCVDRRDRGRCSG